MVLYLQFYLVDERGVISVNSNSGEIYWKCQKDNGMYKHII